nr:hypothetical protein 6 [Bacillales bacterium]
MPVCPNCSHSFSTPTVSITDPVLAKVNVAIKEAVETRIGETSVAEYKRLRRLFRMWITAELRERLNLKSWKQITKDHLEDALQIVNEWPKRYTA